ncbi:inorganic phosphate transporter [Aquimarina agarilytica]|uniref:inorganic phosphate transporter n=1 Tax=Aquimarina agarilytica TaxID=1087449 RepID=UPI0002889FD5|nr:inorganic phosphate transporter [Aquimarina agarilytica]
MDNIYILMIVALAMLAVADLIVGVSNDAVNFLNSAIGSKAVSFKSIMIIASLGVAAGAIFSSGLMEVARKGIFVPAEFHFDEIMIIFMSVMITDILLLDFFNTMGMPTSTTVSIVFELLGAAVCVALIKIGTNDAETMADLGKYINTQKALQIIMGILLSVVVAFSIGALVQYVTRLLITFNFKQKAKWVGALFGGIALMSILYFIVIKGIKGTSYASLIVDQNLGGKPLTLSGFIDTNLFPIASIGLLSLSIISYVLISFLKVDIYKIIIIAGTFALALAFAGNDLVNFIGVPIAAWASYNEWIASGIPANEFSMAVLGKKAETPTLLLLAAGVIMVLTLWFSTKAKDVVKTSIDLSRQGEGSERFKANALSRGIVRSIISIGEGLSAIAPEKFKAFTDRQFDQTQVPVTTLPEDAPAFDTVRAAVNLMVAGVLISIATSMKLPLSTTYVTFMVAMGTSLADRAWGSESAVYRVAGVLNVIGGWFFTAFSAFTAAAILAFLIHLGGPAVIAVLLFVAVFLLVRNSLNYRKKTISVKQDESLLKAESSSVQGVMDESAGNIKSFVNRSSKIYAGAIDGLATYDLAALKKNRKGIDRINNEVEELRDNIFYFIKNLEDSSVSASNFYINILGYLQDISQSIEYVSKASHKHVNNNHRKLRFNQIKDLKEIQGLLETFYSEIKDVFDKKDFDKINTIILEKQDLFDFLTDKINKQVERTRNEEDSPKNTTLYFGLLLETKDLITATMNLLTTYKDERRK